MNNVAINEIHKGQSNAKNSSRRHVLKSIVGMAAASSVAATSPAIADDRLLRLGAEMKELWTWERQVYNIKKSDAKLEAEWDILFDRLGVIAKSISKQPATTLEGFKIKAQAISWCHSGETVDLGDGTTDILIANGIIADLLNT